MRTPSTIIRLVRRRAPWIIAGKVILSLLVLAFATDITVTTTLFQAENGGMVNVTGNLVATDKGFSLAASSSSGVGDTCSSAVVFGVGTAANTVINSGHVVFDVQVNSTSNALPNTKFNVTLVLNSIPYGPLCIQTPAVAADGQTIDCKFDVGASLPSSPYSYTIKVQ